MSRLLAFLRLKQNWILKSNSVSLCSIVCNSLVHTDVRFIFEIDEDWHTEIPLDSIGLFFEECLQLIIDSKAIHRLNY